MPALKWTIDKLRAEAAKYTRRVDFQRKSNPAYISAHQRGMLDDVCGHMQPQRESWTIDALRAEASKYTRRVDFQRKSNAAYQSAQSRPGVLKEICSHMDKYFSEWTHESAQTEAMKYSTRGEFLAKSNKAYKFLLHRGLLDSACAHMQFVYESWDIDSLRLEATKYSTRNEFHKQSNNAYCAASRLGLLSKICGHMSSTRGGFNGFEPGKLYYIKFSSVWAGDLYKIGITNFSIEDRYCLEPLQYEIIAVWDFAVGYDARERERAILKEHKKSLYKGEPILKNGNSELFTHDVLGLDTLALAA